METAAPFGPGELIFTDEQLTLLGDLAGRPGFPGARRPQLDEAAWVAVGRGLAARGAIHDDDPSAPVRLVDMVLGSVLHADRWLLIALTDSEDEGLAGQEVLWLNGDMRVRQTVTSDGFHRFSTAEIDELLAAAFELVTPADGKPGPPRALSADELEQILAGASRILRFDVGRRLADDRVESESLTLVESGEHGLCLLGEDGDVPMLEPVTLDGARQQIGALAATLREVHTNSDAGDEL